jgi:tRNA G37 N-methylase TrmD
VLVSGHHARISAWRRQQAEQLTSDRKPPVA